MEHDIKYLIRKEKELEEEWAKKIAWDGSTGHAPYCRAIPQNIRGIENSTGPCNCYKSK